MTAGWVAVFYVASVVVLVAASFPTIVTTAKINLVALGLALFVFVAAFNAVQAATS